MARQCDLMGTKPQSGHNVSHSNRRTKRTYAPNLQQVTLYSEALKHDVGLRVTTRAIRTVQKHGGLDRFLVDMSPEKLGPVGRQLKRRVHKALGGVPKA